jgi:hypothetical protein
MKTSARLRPVQSAIGSLPISTTTTEILSCPPAAFAESMRAVARSETVTAEQDPVSRLDGHLRPTHGDIGLDADAPREHVPHGMRPRLVLGDLSPIEHRLDHPVITRELLDRAVADQVGSTVAEVRQMNAPAHYRDRDAGRTHVEELGALLSGLVDLPIDIHEGLGEFLPVEGTTDFRGDSGQLAGHHLARHAPASMPSHAVGDGEEAHPGHQEDAVQAGLRRRRRRRGRGEPIPANRSPWSAARYTARLIPSTSCISTSTGRPCSRRAATCCM